MQTRQPSSDINRFCITSVIVTMSNKAVVKGDAYTIRSQSLTNYLIPCSINVDPACPSSRITSDMLYFHLCVLSMCAPNRVTSKMYPAYQMVKTFVRKIVHDVEAVRGLWGINLPFYPHMNNSYIQQDLLYRQIPITLYTLYF